MHHDVIYKFPSFNKQTADFRQPLNHGCHSSCSILRIRIASTEVHAEAVCANKEWSLQDGHGIACDAQEEEGMEHASLASDAEPRRLVAALKACAKENDLHLGTQLHAYILERGFLEKNVYLGNALVSMYVKCDALAKAQDVFDNLPARNVVSWNAVIAGNVLHGYPLKALTCFERMKLDGLSPNSLTYVCVLKACASIGAAEMGASVHAQIVGDKSVEEDVAIGTALVDMYAKCGLLTKAQKVFEDLPVHTVVVWNALIAGYTQHGHGENALRCLEHMQLEGVSPDACTFACILKSCGSLGRFDKGQDVHMRILKEGLLDHDSVLGTALVDMYIKCGLLGKAQKVFDNLSSRNVVSWNALLTGYVQQGNGELTLRYWEHMQSEGFFLDAITCVCILVACSRTGCVSEGQRIHAWILREGLLEEDGVAANALIDMYAKCGLLESACNMLHEVCKRTVVSWNALIAGYAQHGHDEEAIACLKHMQHDGLTPDAITYICILKACSSMGSAYKGQEVHVEITKEAALETDAAVINALLGMYANCGMLIEAQDVFDKLQTRDMITWNALIGGYAQLGDAEHVFILIDNMIVQGLEPDLVTLTAVLNTCNHRGLVTQGQNYFQKMSIHFNILPTLEHHTCIIDLFGRTGHIEKAIAMIKEIPFVSSDFTAWHVVLNACRKWDNMKLGSLAFKQAAHLNEDDAAAYLSASDLCAGSS